MDGLYSGLDAEFGLDSREHFLEAGCKSELLENVGLDAGQALFNVTERVRVLVSSSFDGEQHLHYGSKFKFLVDHSNRELTFLCLLHETHNLVHPLDNKQLILSVVSLRLFERYTSSFPVSSMLSLFLLIIFSVLSLDWCLLLDALIGLSHSLRKEVSLSLRHL